MRALAPLACSLTLGCLGGCEQIDRVPPADAEYSSGCGKAPPADAPGITELMHQGTERSFTLSLPQFYDRDFPFPIIIALHGAGDTGAAIREYAELEAAADGQAVFLYPDALADDDGFARWQADDTDFLDTLVEAVSADLCTDRSRVFTVGFSNGASLANAWACVSQEARGFAAMAGGPPPASCLGPRTAWIGHDRKDTVVDVSFGEAARNAWQDENGCDAQSSNAVSPGPCERFTCSQAELVWCEEDSTALAGHTWPDWASPSIWSLFSSL